VTTFAAFAAGVAATGLLAAAVLTVVLRPLALSLYELCGTRERGRFWTVLASVALVVGTLLASLLGFWWTRTDARGVPLPWSVDEAAGFWTAVAMLQWATAAVLAGLAAMVVVVLVSTARPAAPASAPPPGGSLPASAPDAPGQTVLSTIGSRR
jgi:hypothetical protein